MSTNPHKRTLNVYEVFERANNMTEQDQVSLFQENKYPAVMQMAQLAFGNFEYLIHTDATMPFVPSNEEAPPSNLHKRYQQVAVVVKGAGGDKMPSIQRESIFRGVLESVHPSDAQLINDVIQGKFQAKYPNVSANALAAAFPGVVEASGSVPAPAPAPAPVPEPVVEDASFELNPSDDVVDTEPAVDTDWIAGAAADNLTEMSQETFDELRKAVRREDHRRKKDS